jgi:chromosome segregation ATPase
VTPPNPPAVDVAAVRARWAGEQQPSVERMYHAPTDIAALLAALDQQQRDMAQMRAQRDWLLVDRKNFVRERDILKADLAAAKAAQAQAEQERDRLRAALDRFESGENYLL